MTHYKIAEFMGICSFVDMTKKNITKHLDKVDCPECLTLEKHFRGKLGTVFCYSREDLVRLKILSR